MLIGSKDYFLVEQIAKFKEDNHNLTLGLAAITGSDCYGFRSSNSDYDIRGVFYYNSKEQLKLFNNKKMNFNYTVENPFDQIFIKSLGYGVVSEYRKYDFVFTEVSNFLVNIKRMNCTTLEQLFSNHLVYSTEHFIKLKNIISNNLSKKGIYDSYHGMAIFNYKHYIESDRKPTIKKWLYVIRAYLSGIYALENHKIEQDINTLVKCSELDDKQKMIMYHIIDMKLRNKEDTVISEVTDYDTLKTELLQIRDYLESKLNDVYNECKLPEEPTDLLKEYLDYWLVDLREST